MYIDILEIWSGIAYGQTSSSFDKSYLPATQPRILFFFFFFFFCRFRMIFIDFTRPGMCIDIMVVWFGIANGEISSIFDRVIRDSCGVLSFHFLFIKICILSDFEIEFRIVFYYNK